jgi:hypothetical protein
MSTGASGYAVSSHMAQFKRAQLMQSDTEFADALEEVAEQHDAELEKLPRSEWGKYVRSVMKRNKVVFAIWYTKDDERHCYCIKGMDTPEWARVAMTAFLVGDAGDAEKMKLYWGDGPSNTSAMN